MFTNTLVLSTQFESTGSSQTASLVDVSTGKSIRRVLLSPTDRIEFSIASQKTSENSPLVTQRTVVRVDRIQWDAVLLKEIKASAYIVYSTPGGTIAQNPICDTVLSLIQFMFKPDISSYDISSNPGIVFGADLPSLYDTIIRLNTGNI